MNLQDLDYFVTSNFNELVKSFDMEVGRLVGYLETDEDFYYRVRFLSNGEANDVFVSCVGRLEVISDNMNYEDYRVLDSNYEDILPYEKTIIKESKCR